MVSTSRNSMPVCSDPTKTANKQQIITAVDITYMLLERHFKSENSMYSSI